VIGVTATAKYQSDVAAIWQNATVPYLYMRILSRIAFLYRR
jgi:hypothetical protein